MKTNRSMESIVKFLNKYGITIKESQNTIPNDKIYVKNNIRNEGFFVPKDFNFFSSDYSNKSTTTDYDYRVKDQMSHDSTYYVTVQQDMFVASSLSNPAA